jgi:hypothetical protein
MYNNIVLYVLLPKVKNQLCNGVSKLNLGVRGYLNKIRARLLSSVSYINIIDSQRADPSSIATVTTTIEDHQ